MTKNVDILVTGIHSRLGEPTEKIESAVPGTLKELGDGSMIIEYDEEQDTGSGSAVVHSRVHIAPEHDRVEVIRNGLANSRLCFGEGLSYDTVYMTPYGSMNMKVISNSFEVTVMENEDIKVLAEYVLEIEGNTISNSMVVIEIKKAETA